ncbi:MAG: GIY-YIG nuclease family protein [Spirochaetales bacterium]|nr:GIY-YIG nuclease family protein [Spirochaetales bacterium]
MAFVYILRCSERTLYTGSALDLESRLRLHQAGKASKYTRSRLPVKLVYWEGCRDLRSAYRREYVIKRLTRDEKIILIRQFRSAVTRKNKGSVENEKRRPRSEK